MNRLWVRMSLAFAAVIVIGFFVITVVGVLLIRASLEQSDELRQEILPASFEVALGDLYQTYGNWQGVGDFLAIAQDTIPPLREAQYALVSPEGNLIYGQSTTTFDVLQTLPITVDGQTQAVLLVGPNQARQTAPFQPFPFVRGVGIEEFMLLTTFVGGVMGVLFGILMSRSLTTPLEDLALATHAIGKGELERRVKATGTSEIRLLADSFNRMADALQNAEKLRRNLVADVAHELRTPINALQTNLYALVDDTYPLTKQEIAGLYEQTRMLSRLVNDLHELSQADAKQLPLQQQKIDMSSALEDMVTPFYMVAETKNIQFDLVKADRPTPVMIDAARINQVLHNLLNNALRHTPEGGTITLKLAADDDSVRITVADTGDGIRPEHLPHIFERFYRGDPGRSRDMGGTGLGLAVAKALVEAHGGTITAESEVGKGTAVTVCLPRHAGQVVSVAA
ncbi:MAG: HAMP domain-containing protein [Anaerolineae bacterium]|nr:HAMP domain-containing protein [Anaerolineae bacterium]